MYLVPTSNTRDLTVTQDPVSALSSIQGESGLMMETDRRGTSSEALRTGRGGFLMREKYNYTVQHGSHLSHAAPEYLKYG